MVSKITYIKSLATVALLSMTAFIAGCGGGGAADPFAVPPAVVIPPLVVSPNSLTVTQGTSATLTISSGVAPFQVFTSNAFALPVVQAVADKTITLTPVNITSETTVTITVRDSASQSVTVSVTAKPPVIPALGVNPVALTVYSGIPSVLTIDRGVGPFQAFSSDALVLPVVQAASGTSIFLLASSVSSDKLVTITVRDAAGQSVAVPVTVKPTPIAGALVVTPTVLNIYSGTPSRVTINSGVGPFQVFSSDSAVLPVVQAVAGTAVTLTAATVSVDTVVTLTIRDAAAQSTTVTVTVKPSPVLGTMLITPVSNSTCAGAPANTVDRAAICSGESGVASITVRSNNTSVLPNRQIRFEVVQGAFNFVVDSAGTTFAKSLTITTDQNGKADVAIRTDSGVPSQAALIRATDLTSGNRVDGAFTIVQATNGTATLNVVPQTYRGAGGFTGQCVSFSGDYVVYGGTPPYTITNGLPNAGTLTSGTSSGQIVTVTTQGGIFRFTSFAADDNCGGFTAPITIADATGRAIGTTTFVVAAGSTARVPAVLSPSSVSFTANQGGSPAVAGVPAIAAACSDGSKPVGTSCGFTAYAAASCANGVVNDANTGCKPVTYVPARCVNANGSAGIVINDPTTGTPIGCQPPPVTVPVTPQAIYTPPTCVNGVPNSSFTGCVTPVTFTAATCTNGTIIYSTVASSCAQATYSGGFAGSPAIAAVPNTQCSGRSVVYTINGGLTPYVLSSSFPGVLPATATVNISPSNITFAYPTLNVGTIVTITAVDAKGALFTTTATCAAGT